MATHEGETLETASGSSQRPLGVSEIASDVHVGMTETDQQGPATHGGKGQSRAGNSVIDDGRGLKNGAMPRRQDSQVKADLSVSA